MSATYGRIAWKNAPNTGPPRKPCKCASTEVQVMRRMKQAGSSVQRLSSKSTHSGAARNDSAARSYAATNPPSRSAGRRYLMYSVTIGNSPASGAGRDQVRTFWWVGGLVVEGYRG